MNRWKTYLVFWIVLLFSSPAAEAASSARTDRQITVSAAISLRNAFEEIGSLFEAKRGVSVFFNFGASGSLSRQIEGGAPVDVFASASQKEMDSLDDGGFISRPSRANFASNAVVLIAPPDSNTGLSSFEGLASPEIRRVAVGNPRTVPAGMYAEEILRHFGLMPSLNHKLIFTENVRQVLDYVSRREVDCGIVYATDAAMQKTQIRIVSVAPAGSHRAVVYPIAVTAQSRNTALAKAFVSLVLSPEGQKILEKHGFLKP